VLELELKPSYTVLLAHDLVKIKLSQINDHEGKETRRGDEEGNINYWNVFNYHCT
jgi:ribosomal protein L5